MLGTNFREQECQQTMAVCTIHRLYIKMDDVSPLPPPHCTKVKPKYPGYGRRHFVPVTSFGASLHSSDRGRSRGIEGPPIHPPDSIGNQ